MYDPDNIFAKILKGEIPCDEVYSDDEILAFRDISPAAPVHILVVPRNEYTSFNDFVETAGRDEITHFFSTVQHIAEQAGLVSTGYRLITNHGENASQSVPHFHVHILGGKPLGGLLPGDTQER